MKRIIAILLSVVIFFAFSSCGNNDNQNIASNSNINTSESTEVSSTDSVSSTISSVSNESSSQSSVSSEESKNNNSSSAISSNKNPSKNYGYSDTGAKDPFKNGVISTESSSKVSSTNSSKINSSKVSSSNSSSSKKPVSNVSSSSSSKNTSSKDSSSVSSSMKPIVAYPGVSSNSSSSKVSSSSSSVNSNEPYCIFCKKNKSYVNAEYRCNDCQAYVNKGYVYCRCGSHYVESFYNDTKYCYQCTKDINDSFVPLPEVIGYCKRCGRQFGTEPGMCEPYSTNQIDEHGLVIYECKWYD